MKINSINSGNYSNNYYSGNFSANISFEKRLPRNFYRPKFVKATLATLEQLSRTLPEMG